MLKPILAVCLVASVCGPLAPPADALAADNASTSAIVWSLYLDGAYLHSSTQPENNTWRTKTTSTTLDEFRLNNATVAVQKKAFPSSPWGFLTGAQAGDDIDRLVSPTSVDDADDLKHLYYTNVTFLLNRGRGVEFTGGLIPGHLGYESFHALENPTYTRIYGIDTAPYFNWGVKATLAPGTASATSLYVLNAWDYLSKENSAPAYGLQFDWTGVTGGKLKQSFYYGPEQSDTSREFWRFVTNTVFEVDRNGKLVAGEFGYGSEKQASMDGQPRQSWLWAALWLRWPVNPKWNAVIRPEIFRDQDGLISGARQTIAAITTGLEGRALTVGNHVVALKFEYRFDRSTGAGGGFYEGDLNQLVRDQHLFIGALVVKFATPDGS